MHHMEITYYTKDVYGAPLRYPVSDDAKMVCALTNTKTLTEFAMTILFENGIARTEVIRPR